jgi:hypothetical protein
MEWLSRNRPEPQQLKFWNEERQCWEIDGFACVAAPFCKSLYPDESIWKQRKEYMEAIIKSNKEQEERQKFASQLLGGPIGSSMPRL